MKKSKSKSTREVIGSYQKRKHMIQQLLDGEDDFQLDGVNIDFENVYPKFSITT